MKKNGTHENFKRVAKNYFRKEDIFLVPNLLCYLRILLVIGFVICYLTPFTINGNPLANVYVATALMMVAAYSDFIDGYIARTFQQQSELGKFLDPVSDKFLQLGISIILLVRYYNSPYVCSMFTIFLAKEFTLFFEDLLLARRNTSFEGAKWYGKVSSFVFYLVTGFILIIVPLLKLNIEELKWMTIINICCSIAILCLTIAWVLYFILFLKMMKQAKPTSEDKNTSENSNHD